MSLCYILYYIDRKTEILKVTFSWSESWGHGNFLTLKLLNSSVLSIALICFHTSLFSYRLEVIQAILY